MQEPTAPVNRPWFLKNVGTAIVFTVLLWPDLVGCVHAADKQLGDKTLVAWVCMSDFVQQGGSVLTLIDKSERFDAIVLGEVAMGKWMGGSDYFRRTHQDQSTWPKETVEAGTLVQIAIVYKGKLVTLYRNGKKYASYPIARPQSFGSDAMVLIGLRYLGKEGEIGFFNGQIDDVRIYDSPLTVEQIAILKPNRLSDMKPLAWWNFEGGKTLDAMKTFPEVRLVSAVVTDGKLCLNGNAYLLAGRDKKSLPKELDENLKRKVQTVFYKSQSKRTGNMWDTWVYLHNGKYYMYTLGAAGGKWWGNISLARSPDGVHWREIGRVIAKGRGAWMGTGSTWKSPDFKRDGKFFMNFSEAPMRTQQSIFFAESRDLVHWTRLGSRCEFVQDERWYEKEGRWDCIWTMPRPGGGLYGYWTATPKKGTGGRFGFGESRDGVTWKALPPPKVTGAVAGEVGAIQKIGARYYMMFGQNGSLQGGRMVTLVADKPSGPFHAARKNKVLLSGNTYFSRFLAIPGALLVNHHAIARNGQVSFAPLKLGVLDKEGTLRLGWWKGNEKMKHKRIEVKPPTPANSASAPALIENVFDVHAGVIVEGKLLLPVAKNRRRGLYIGCDKGPGGAVLFDSAGIAQFGTMKADGSDFKVEKTVNREMAFGSPATFRLLLKGSLMEFYLNDILIECYSLPLTASGKIGLINGGKSAAFSDLVAWR